jgi:hypothetical protein
MYSTNIVPMFVEFFQFNDENCSSQCEIWLGDGRYGRLPYGYLNKGPAFGSTWGEEIDYVW